MTATEHPTLTIIGLGSGRWESLTLEAAAALQQAGEVYLVSAVYPPLDSIRAHLPDTIFHSLDFPEEADFSLVELHRQIVDEVSRLLAAGVDVFYAVPGSPSLGDQTVRMLRERHADRTAAVRLIGGVSYVETTLLATEAAGAEWLQVLDASEIARLAAENAVGEVPSSTKLNPWRAPLPTTPLLVSPPQRAEIAAAVRRWLARFYPDDHQVTLVDWAVEARVRSIPLRRLDYLHGADLGAAILVPALAETDNVRTFAGVMQLTRRLRGPDGCPWDREQTHASLKQHLLEETYEVLDALDSADPAAIAEEFGDLLYQITLHAQIGAENGSYTIEDVIQNIVVKLTGRHPHVFGDLELNSAQDVLHAWEGFKQRQKPERASVLEGIPRGLPALPHSQLMQKRAANLGFEWAQVGDVIDKVEEELTELRQEVEAKASRERQRAELGDILFALVSVARHLRIDPEEALRLANRKFAWRFRHVEAQVKASGVPFRALSPEALDEMWNRARAEEIDGAI